MDGVVAGTDQGVRLPDGSLELQGVPITAIARHPNRSSTTFCSAFGGTYASEDGGRTWRAIGLDGMDVWTVVAREERGAVSLWAGVEPAALWRREWPAGEWERVTGLDRAPGAGEWYSPWGPADLSSITFFDGEIWVGIEVGGAYRSRDGGATWEAAGSGLDEDVHTVAVTPGARYAATGGGFYRSEGEAWEPAADGIRRRYVMPIVVDAGDPAHVWTAGASGSPPWTSGAGAEVYESTDAGRTWRALPPLPSGVRGAVQRKGLARAPRGLVAGTSDGALLAYDGAGWETLADGLPEITAVLAE